MAEIFGINAGLLIAVYLLIFFAGFVDASAGGGGLISIPAYLLLGLPAHTTLGCNKFSNAFGTLLAAVKFWKSKAVNINASLCAAAGAFIGSTIGSHIALFLSDRVIRIMLLIMLPCAAVLIFAKRDVPDTDRSVLLSRRKLSVLSFIIGVLIGIYDGLVGPGTGTFAILAFTLITGFDLRKASGCAKTLNAASNIASIVAFGAAGSVAYSIAIPGAVFNMAGSYFGAKFALTKGAKFIRPMMIFVIALMLVKMFYEVVCK